MKKKEERLGAYIDVVKELKKNVMLQEELVAKLECVTGNMKYVITALELEDRDLADDAAVPGDRASDKTGTGPEIQPLCQRIDTLIRVVHEEMDMLAKERQELGEKKEQLQELIQKYSDRLERV